MKKILMNNYEKIQKMIDVIKVGIFITDGRGKVLMVNEESEKVGHMSKRELVNKTVYELIEVGYMENSTVLNVMKSKREESIIQRLGSGEQLYITGTPIITNGKIDLIICTERDITETINLKRLLMETEKIAEAYELRLKLLENKQNIPEGEIVGSSREMQNIIDMALRIAKIDTKVFISGESGTGKELIAGLVHRNSKRNEGPFIKINCAAIPENLLESELFGYERGAFTGANQNGKLGVFELANKGTLFLDEIGEMSMTMQSKLLRVLQEQEIIRIGGDKALPVDVRIISATNLDIKKALSEGRFRKDLYYRLDIFPIAIPPLRERKVDIKTLTFHFIDKFNSSYNLNKTISIDAIRVLEEYSWPGNVRELRNIIERIMIAFDGNEITKFQLNYQLREASGLEEAKYKSEENRTLEEKMSTYEKKIIKDLMEEHKNGSKVAEILGVNKSTISRKMKKYRIG